MKLSEAKKRISEYQSRTKEQYRQSLGTKVNDSGGCCGRKS